MVIAGSLESAYSLIWGSHEIWGKGGRGHLGTFKISKVVIGRNSAFGMGHGGLTNQHPAWEIWQEILREMLWVILWEMLWEMLQENVAGNVARNVAGQGGGDKAYLRKAVIGGNLAFGIG